MAVCSSVRQHFWLKGKRALKPLYIKAEEKIIFISGSSAEWKSESMVTKWLTRLLWQGVGAREIARETSQAHIKSLQLSLVVVQYTGAIPETGCESGSSQMQLVHCLVGTWRRSGCHEKGRTSAHNFVCTVYLTIYFISPFFLARYLLCIYTRGSYNSHFLSRFIYRRNSAGW